MQDLDPGEHVDLDNGIRVKRKPNGSQYVIDHPDLGRTVLEADEIKAVAELAGFTITGRSVSW